VSSGDGLLIRIASGRCRRRVLVNLSWLSDSDILSSKVFSGSLVDGSALFILASDVPAQAWPESPGFGLASPGLGFTKC
jgi:hypothetical protein